MSAAASPDHTQKSRLTDMGLQTYTVFRRERRMQQLGLPNSHLRRALHNRSRPYNVNKVYQHCEGKRKYEEDEANLSA
jgi:hypothetical protein